MSLLRRLFGRREAMDEWRSGLEQPSRLVADAGPEDDVPDLYKN